MHIISMHNDCQYDVHMEIYTTSDMKKEFM